MKNFMPRSFSFLGYKFMFYGSYIILLMIISLITLVSYLLQIPVERFTRDIAAILGINPFTGLLSNLGVLLWCFTVAICFFTVAIIRFNKGHEYTGFLFTAGLFTAVLMIDDLFMFHEYVFPVKLHIPEKLIDGSYILLMMLFLYKYYKIILKNDFLPLFLAYCFFSLSISMDVFFAQEGLEFLFEDGLKILGIISWFIFFSRVCFNQIYSVALKSEAVPKNKVTQEKELVDYN